jgi:hypothetical protein
MQTLMQWVSLNVIVDDVISWKTFLFKTVTLDWEQAGSIEKLI